MRIYTTGPRIDLTGQTFSRLTVMSYSHSNKSRSSVWNCQCVCGKQTLVDGSSLKSGNTTSCGCYHKEKSTKHGLYYTSDVYHIFFGIKNRCTNARNKDFPNYGGRGITMCERWINSVETFIKDMGPRPSKKHSVDRIDVNGPYSPENCRWADSSRQQRNRRGVKQLTYNGLTMGQNDWAEHLDLPVSTIAGRLLRGWGVAETLSIPYGGSRPA